MQTLEQRINKLEKQARFYRTGMIVLAAILPALMFMSFDKEEKPQDVIRAKAVEIVNNRGNVVAKLESNPDRGYGELNTYTSGGKRLISLFASSGGSGAINTFDENEMPVFKVTQTTGGGGYMALMNSNVKEIVEFGTTDADGGYMRINDGYGDKLAGITYTENGGGYFSLFNASKETIRLSTSREGGRVGIYNRNNKRIAYIGTEANLDGNISTYRNDGTRIGGFPAY